MNPEMPESSRAKLPPVAEILDTSAAQPRTARHVFCVKIVNQS